MAQQDPINRLDESGGLSRARYKHGAILAIVTAIGIAISTFAFRTILELERGEQMTVLAARAEYTAHAAQTYLRELYALASVSAVLPADSPENDTHLVPNHYAFQKLLQTPGVKGLVLLPPEAVRDPGPRLDPTGANNIVLLTLPVGNELGSDGPVGVVRVRFDPHGALPSAFTAKQNQLSIATDSGLIWETGDRINSDGEYVGLTMFEFAGARWTAAATGAMSIPITAWVMLASGILLTGLVVYGLYIAGASGLPGATLWDHRGDLPRIMSVLLHEARGHRRERARSRDLQRRLADAVESLSEGFAYFTSDGKLALYNRALCEIYPSLSRTIEKGTDSQTLNALADALGVVRNGPMAFPTCFRQGSDLKESDFVPRRVPLASGRRLLIRERATRDGGVVAIHADITPLEEATDALARSKALLNAVLENSPTPVHVKDRDHRFILANRPFEILYGVKRDDLIGRDAQQTFGSDSPLYAEPQENEVLMSGMAAIGERSHIIGDVPHKFLTLRFPVRNADGKIEGVGCIETDITEREKIRADVFQNSKLATLGEMAAGIAHELSQPVYSVRLVAESLIGRLKTNVVPDEELLDQLRTIEEQCTQASEILGQLGMFTHPSTQYSEIFSLTDQAEYIARVLRRQLQDDGIELVVDISDGEHKAQGSPGRLTQVLVNLINNSRDAIVASKCDRTEANLQSEHDRIVLRVERDREHGTERISVSDTGGGVRDDIRNQIFNPFFTTKDVGEGTGLGLYICHSIIQQMGGRIEFGNVGDGAQFTVCLPSAWASQGRGSPSTVEPTNVGS